MAIYKEIIENLEKYEKWLATGNYSRSTQKVYLARIKDFSSYLESQEENNDISALIEQYKTTQLSTERLKPSTVNVALTALDNYLCLLGVGNPGAKRASRYQRYPRFLSPQEELRLLAAASRWPSAKPRALILLCLNAGLRIGQLVELNLSDVFIFDAKDAWLSVPGAKLRQKLPINESVSETLFDWLKEREMLNQSSQCQALFVNSSGCRISTGGVDYLIRRVGFEARLQISARLLRSTYLQRVKERRPATNLPFKGPATFLGAPQDFVRHC